MSLDAKLATTINTIPECVAAGYVDIGSGMLLSVKTVDSHPQEVIALVAAATADLFAGQNITMIEKLFKKSRGLEDDGHHYFQEIVVNSDNLIHVGFHKIAVAEAQKLGIPLVGVVDTNHSPVGIDYVIPGNDDSARAVALYARGIADAVLEGRANAVTEVAKAAAAEGGDEFVEVDDAAAA